MNATNINGGNTVSTAAYKVATALGAHQLNSSPVHTKKHAVTDATTGGNSSTTSADPSTITSSDFLTLLVSELKNQDPTQPTDPNAYITQLVGVNSLQQLISIDQGITALDPTTTTTSSSV